MDNQNPHTDDVAIAPSPEAAPSELTLQERALQKPATEPTAVSRRFMIRAGIGSALVATMGGFAWPYIGDAEFAVVNYYYHFMWVLVICLSAVILDFWRGKSLLEATERSRLLTIGTVGILGILTIIFATEWEFRILADEANLLGLSLAMNLDRTYRNIIEGSFYYDAFHPTVYSTDPRPALHPFLVSLLHDFFGYSANHSFVINLVAATLVLSLLFHIGRQLGGLAAGVFVAILMVANPIFTLGATSSGFEPLNILFVTFTLWSVYKFLTDPSPQRLAMMVFSAVATVHCRYESVILLLPVATAIIYRWKELRFDRGSYLLLVAPLLLLPYAWQRSYSALAHEVDASKPVFSATYIPENLTQFARFAFDRGGSKFPMNPYLACLVAGGLVLLAGLLFRRRDKSREREAAFLATIGVGGVFMVHMACWVVDYRTVAVQRYAISYASAFALLGAWPLARLVTVRYGRLLAWGAAFFILFQGLAKAGHNTQGRWLTLYREYKTNLEFLTKWPRQGTLFICDRPGMYAVHKYGAMSFESANKNPNSVLDGIRRKLNPNIFVEQRIYYDKPGKPSPELSPKMPTETVYEYQNDSQYYIRISRIVAPPHLPLSKRR